MQVFVSLCLDTISFLGEIVFLRAQKTDHEQAYQDLPQLPVLIFRSGQKMAYHDFWVFSDCLRIVAERKFGSV